MRHPNAAYALTHSFSFSLSLSLSLRWPPLGPVRITNEATYVHAHTYSLSHTHTLSLSLSFSLPFSVSLRLQTLCFITRKTTCVHTHTHSILHTLTYSLFLSLSRFLSGCRLCVLQATHKRGYKSTPTHSLALTHTLSLSLSHYLFLPLSQVADFGFCVQLTKESTSRSSVLGTPYWCVRYIRIYTHMKSIYIINKRVVCDSEYHTQ